MKFISLLITLMLSFYSMMALADLTKEEVACNKALNDNQPKVAIEKADALIKADSNNANAWTCKGRALFALEDNEGAIDAFREAEKVTSDNYEKSFAQLLIGHVHKNQSELDQAIESYKKSLNYAKAINFQALILNNHLNIGHVYMLQSKQQQALNAYESAYSVAANDNERADTESNVAAAAFALEQYDKAIEYQVKALLMFEKVGTLDQYANALAQLAHYQTVANDLSDAERSCNKLIKLAKDNGGPYYIAKGQLLLAKVKMAEQNTSRARALLNEAKQTANQVQDQALIDEIKAYETSL